MIFRIEKRRLRKNCGRILTLPPERQAPTRQHLHVHDHSACRFGNRRSHSHGIVWLRCQDVTKNGGLKTMRCCYVMVCAIVAATCRL